MSPYRGPEARRVPRRWSPATPCVPFAVVSVLPAPTAQEIIAGVEARRNAHRDERPRYRRRLPGYLPPLLNARHHRRHRP